MFSEFLLKGEKYNQTITTLKEHIARLNESSQLDNKIKEKIKTIEQFLEFHENKEINGRTYWQFGEQCKIQYRAEAEEKAAATGKEQKASFNDKLALLHKEYNPGMKKYEDRLQDSLRALIDYEKNKKNKSNKTAIAQLEECMKYLKIVPMHRKDIDEMKKPHHLCEVNTKCSELRNRLNTDLMLQSVPKKLNDKVAIVSCDVRLDAKKYSDHTRELFNLVDDKYKFQRFLQR